MGQWADCPSPGMNYSSPGMNYSNPGMYFYSSFLISVLMLAVTVSAKVEGDLSDTELPTQSPTTATKTRGGVGVVGVMCWLSYSLSCWSCWPSAATVGNLNLPGFSGNIVSELCVVEGDLCDTELPTQSPTTATTTRTYPDGGTP